MITHIYWYDEAISLLISRLSLQDLLMATAADTHPPLFYLLRLPPVIPFIFSLFLMYLLARRRGLLLFLVSPLHLYYATQLRMYSLAVFFYLLLLTGFVRHKPRIYFLAAVLGLYTHYYFIPALIAFSLFNRKTFILNLFALLVFLPWLVFTLSYSHASIWTFPFYISLPATFISYTIGGLGSTTLRTMLGIHTPLFIRVLALSVSLWMFAKFIVSRHPAKKLFLLSLLASLPFFSPRAMLIFSPLYLIALARNLTLPKQLILASCLLFFFIYFYRIDYWYPSLNSLAQQLSQLPQDSAVIHTSTYTYFPSLVHNPGIYNFLSGPTGLSPVTNQLLRVASMPPKVFSHIYTVSVDLSTAPATINLK